jgi:hypothetical protein
MDPVRPQSQHRLGSIDENFFDYVRKVVIEQPPDNSFDCLTCSVAATEACIQLTAILPEGRSAIASSSQPVLCSDRNSNSDDICNCNNIINNPNNTNLTSIEKTR